MKQILFPPPQEIAHLEADINYTTIYLTNGEKVISSYTLKRYQENLKDLGFIRIHRKHLVNKTEIISVKLSGNFRRAVLKSGKELQISRRTSIQ